MKDDSYMTQASAVKTLQAVTLDEKTVIKRSDLIETEKSIALNDLMHDHHFVVRDYPKAKQGELCLRLATRDNKLVFFISSQNNNGFKGEYNLSLSPFRRVVKDYFLVCENYYEALRSNLTMVEAIDMGRRAIHNDGADIVMELTESFLELDHATARRLFTLICILHLERL